MMVDFINSWYEVMCVCSLVQGRGCSCELESAVGLLVHYQNIDGFSRHAHIVFGLIARREIEEQEGGQDNQQNSATRNN